MQSTTPGSEANFKPEEPAGRRLTDQGSGVYTKQYRRRLAVEHEFQPRDPGVYPWAMVPRITIHTYAKQCLYKLQAAIYRV